MQISEHLKNNLFSQTHNSWPAWPYGIWNCQQLDYW